MYLSSVIIGKWERMWTYLFFIMYIQLRHHVHSLEIIQKFWIYPKQVFFIRRKGSCVVTWWFYGCTCLDCIIRICLNSTLAKTLHFKFTTLLWSCPNNRESIIRQHIPQENFTYLMWISTITLSIFPLCRRINSLTLSWFPIIICSLS